MATLVDKRASLRPECCLKVDLRGCYIGSTEEEYLSLRLNSSGPTCATLPNIPTRGFVVYSSNDGTRICCIGYLGCGDIASPLLELKQIGGIEHVQRCRSASPSRFTGSRPPLALPSRPWPR